MIPAKCRVKHDPENGLYGDCVRACIASLLELDTEKVPHFYEDNCDGEVGAERIRAWLNSQGYAPFVAVYSGDQSPQEIRDFQAELNPNVHYLLFGSGSEGDHVVVCHNANVVNDPSWFAAPIVKANSSGHYIIMVIVKL